MGKGLLFADISNKEAMADINTWLILVNLMLTTVTTIFLGVRFRSKCFGASLSMRPSKARREESETPSPERDE